MELVSQIGGCVLDGLDPLNARRHFVLTEILKGRNEMKTSKALLAVLTLAMVSGSAAYAQEPEPRWVHGEVRIQGTGFFTDQTELEKHPGALRTSIVSKSTFFHDLCIMLKPPTAL